MTFTPTTQERIRKLNSFTGGAVGLSAKTVGQVGKYAQNIGASMTRRGEAKQKTAKGYDKDGKPVDSYKPGLLNKSMIAFSTIADGIDHSARQLLTSGSTAATTMVGHRYGDEARVVAGHLAGGVKNVGLVYVDAVGVSRKAVLKSVAKGMVVGKVPGGGDLVVGAGDGGQVPPELMETKEAKGAIANSAYGQEPKPGQGQVGFGNALPPSYAERNVGEPLGAGALQGQESYYGNEKR